MMFDRIDAIAEQILHRQLLIMQQNGMQQQNSHSYIIGMRVCVTYCRGNQWIWDEGIIVQKISDTSYVVQLKDQCIWANFNQIAPHSLGFNSNSKYLENQRRNFLCAPDEPMDID